MPDLIPPPYKSHLREVLAARMALPVELEVATCESCESCDRAVSLVDKLTRLSDKINVRMTEGDLDQDTDEGTQSLEAFDQGQGQGRLFASVLPCSDWLRA